MSKDCLGYSASEMASLNVINDLANGTMSFFGKVARADSDRTAFAEATNKLAQLVGTASGVPIKNVEDLLLGAYDNVFGILDDECVIHPGLVDRKQWDYGIQKLIGDSEVSGVSKERVEELDQLICVNITE